MRLENGRGKERVEVKNSMERDKKMRIGQGRVKIVRSKFVYNFMGLF